MFLKILLRLAALKRINGKSISGFTLLELLVALIMASVIISSLLTFVVSVLDTDSKERAKVQSQEEIQSALNYIADDMQQAIYIYDADGMYLNVTGVGNSAPTNAVVQQIPSGTDRTPILMFWKRHHYDRNDDVPTSSGPKKVGCLDYPDNGATCIDASGQPKGSDKYAYSLVVYYLVKDTNSSTWSNTSRIARWELRDGIRWSCVDQSTAAQNNAALCPTADQRPDVPTTGINWNVDTNGYVVLPDAGFLRFDASGAGTLSDRLNRWKVSAVNNDPDKLRTLIDYVDDSDYVPAQDGAGTSPIKIGLEKNSPIATGSYPPAPGTQSKNQFCDRAGSGVGVGLSDAEVGTGVQNIFSQRIPPEFNSAFTVNGINTNPTGLSSFYSCVNASRVTARVYIRGNALARLEPNKNFRFITNDKLTGFVPTSSVRVFGRGSLSLE